MASIEEMTVKDIHLDVSFIIHENFLLVFGEIHRMSYLKNAGSLFTYGWVGIFVFEDLRKMLCLCHGKVLDYFSKGKGKNCKYWDS